jgi:group I intron endonuclease
MTINKENLLGNQPNKRPFSGLYTIICLSNQKQYIGQSANVPNRLSKHLSELRYNRHFCTELQNDFNLYTHKNFIFQRLALAEGLDKKFREKIETHLIELIPKQFLYNKFASPSQRTGHLNGFSGHKHTVETKSKISLANSGSGLKRNRKPVQINDIIYNSVTEAERQTGIARRLIRERCHAEHHQNYHWVDQDS